MEDDLTLPSHFMMHVGLSRHLPAGLPQARILAMGGKLDHFKYRRANQARIATTNSTRCIQREVKQNGRDSSTICSYGRKEFTQQLRMKKIWEPNQQKGWRTVRLHGVGDGCRLLCGGVGG